MRLSVIASTVLVLLAPVCPAAATGSAATGSARNSRLVTLDYANADVADVLRALAAQSNVNIALNPGAKSLVTVHLRDKSVDDAILVVANMAGLAARVVSETYVIAPRAEMRQALERLGATRVVQVKQIAPKDAGAMVEAALPDLTARPQGKHLVLVGAPEDLDQAEQLVRQNDVVSAADLATTQRIALKHRTGASLATALNKMITGLSAESAGAAIVVSGPRSTVDRVVQTVAMLDVPSQDDSEVRVYRAKYVVAGQLIDVLTRLVPGIRVAPGPEASPPAQPKFNILSGQVAGVMTVGGYTGDESKPTTLAAPGAENVETKVAAGVTTLVLSGTPADLDAAARILEKIDVKPKQVLIEAKVVETSPELAEQIGVKWSWDVFQLIERPAGTATSPTTHLPLGESTIKSRPGSFSRIPSAFQAELNAMVTSSQTKMLANPRLAVINDQDASFFVGDTIRVRVLAQASATAGSQYTVLEVPVGIVLLVHPRVNDDGFISMRIHPVVSTLSGLVDGLPQTSAREADTSVRLQDGDTLVMGGLIQDTDVRRMQKVPLLGDLPILGHLFRNTERSHRRTEIMVFVTVRVLPN